MPAATGKFSIWTAKMNAATSPAIGASFSESVSLALWRLYPMPPAETTPAAAETPALMNPSGMCTLPPPRA